MHWWRRGSSKKPSDTTSTSTGSRGIGQCLWRGSFSSWKASSAFCRDSFFVLVCAISPALFAEDPDHAGGLVGANDNFAHLTRILPWGEETDSFWNDDGSIRCRLVGSRAGFHLTRVLLALTLTKCLVTEQQAFLATAEGDEIVQESMKFGKKRGPNGPSSQ